MSDREVNRRKTRFEDHFEKKPPPAVDNVYVYNGYVYVAIQDKIPLEIFIKFGFKGFES